MSLRIDGQRLQRSRDWGFGWHVFHVEQDVIWADRLYFDVQYLF